MRVLTSRMTGLLSGNKNIRKSFLYVLLCVCVWTYTCACHSVLHSYTYIREYMFYLGYRMHSDYLLNDGNIFWNSAPEWRYINCGSCYAGYNFNTIPVALLTRAICSLYWLPELIKDPSTHRFIVGSACCSIKSRSTKLTTVLTVAKEGLHKHFENSYSWNGKVVLIRVATEGTNIPYYEIWGNILWHIIQITSTLKVTSSVCSTLWYTALLGEHIF